MYKKTLTHNASKSGDGLQYIHDPAVMMPSFPLSKRGAETGVQKVVNFGVGEIDGMTRPRRVAERKSRPGGAICA